MDFTRNFGALAAHLQPKPIYQDTSDTSSHYRNDLRIWHPLTEHQFGNGFRVGDRVMMLLSYDNNDTKSKYVNLTVVHIITYETTRSVLGSYNADDAFKGVPFTRVLVLE
uniref:Uncharacterized protein n=1 Tax=viral metagenome TaxID=1070528 RepID=A0A6C0ANG7_9ZZZZ